MNLEEHSGVSGPIDPTVAAELLSGLRSGLRGTDFVGWYRQGRVVGAVSTESRSRHGTDVARVVTSRVTQMLSLRLRQEDAQRLRVRVDRCAMPDATSPDHLQELRLTGLLRRILMLKVGVIGYGYWGPNVVRNFAIQPDCQIMAICDKNPRRWRRFRAATRQRG